MPTPTRYNVNTAEHVAAVKIVVGFQNTQVVYFAHGSKLAPLVPVLPPYTSRVSLHERHAQPLAEAGLELEGGQTWLFSIRGANKAIFTLNPY
jgi:hypothetical protein